MASDQLTVTLDGRDIRKAVDDAILQTLQEIKRTIAAYEARLAALEQDIGRMVDERAAQRTLPETLADLGEPLETSDHGKQG